MFEHMGHKPELIWNDSRHCQSDAAKLAYNRSHVLLENTEERGKMPTHCRLDIQNGPDMYEFKFAIWCNVTSQFFITLFLVLVVICLVRIHRQWHRSL